MAGAIRRAGGPAVDEESRAAAPIGLGEAVETTAGDMPARWVVHAATMELGGPTSADIIRRATAATLAPRRRARGAQPRARRLRHGRRRLPARGRGADRGGGGPPAPRRRLGLERVVFAVHGEAARAAFEAALDAGS